MMRMVWALVALSVGGCFTLDTDVPQERCSRGEPLPLSDALSESCRRAIHEALGRDTAFDGFVAMRGEELLVRWGDTSSPTNVASVRKSVLALLYGIAAERGLVDLDASLAELGIDDAPQPLTELERTATVRDLLQSRSGVILDAIGQPGSWIAVAPERGAHAPGERFYYNNWDFNVLGTIFERETGMPLERALEDWLAEPLGLQTYCTSHVTYETASFTEHAMYRFYMSAEDLARIGALVAQGGRWRGEQLVPEDWIAEITRPVSDAREVREDVHYAAYGYLWWIDDEGHWWADGSGGQYIHVDPSTGLVTVARNQTGNSVPGRIWHDLAQDDDDAKVTPARARAVHQEILECAR